MSFSEKECLLFNFQFSFRKGYSTEYAILETLENLKSALDDEKNNMWYLSRYVKVGNDESKGICECCAA